MPCIAWPVGGCCRVCWSEKVCTCLLVGDRVVRDSDECLFQLSERKIHQLQCVSRDERVLFIEAELCGMWQWRWDGRKISRSYTFLLLYGSGNHSCTRKCPRPTELLLEGEWQHVQLAVIGIHILTRSWFTVLQCQNYNSHIDLKRFDPSLFLVTHGKL